MRQSLVDEIKADPFYARCIYEGCHRTPEWEHSLYYAGKRIEEKFAIVPVCPFHHRKKNNGKPVDKRLHEYHAIRRMSKEDREKYPKVNWEQKLEYLKSIYETDV